MDSLAVRGSEQGEGGGRRLSLLPPMPGTTFIAFSSCFFYYERNVIPDFDLEEEEPHLPAPTEEELDETLPTPPPVPQSLLVGRQV